MKKTTYLAVFGLAILNPVVILLADDFSNNFGSHINETALDALAQDLGAVIGGSSFHQGKVLSFPVGFDVGVHGASLGVQNDNKILRDDGSATQALFGQLEVGLPFKVNVIGRVGSLEDADILGGGLRVGLFTSVVPGLPSVSLTGLYSRTEHDYFDADVYSANAVLSFDIPFIRPYIGAGYDSTQLDITDTALQSAPAGTAKKDGSASGYRVEGGINLSLIPFTYISLGAGLANGQELYHLGAGVKF